MKSKGIRWEVRERKGTEGAAVLAGEREFEGKAKVHTHTTTLVPIGNPGVTELSESISEGEHLPMCREDAPTTLF